MEENPKYTDLITLPQYEGVLKEKPKETFDELELEFKKERESILKNRE